MDTARQILRYSIPGSLFILSVAVIQAVLWITWKQPIPSAISDLPTGLVIGLLASSVPIGFILYQLYYAAMARIECLVCL